MGIRFSYSFYSLFPFVVWRQGKADCKIEEAEGFVAKSSFSLVSFVCVFFRYISNYSVTPPSFPFLELFVF